MIPPSSASFQALAPAATPTWAPAAAPAWATAPNRPRLGRFVLGPELGRGGMGVVHLAWDPLLRRLVALKQLLNADPLLALRFMREAQIQAKVEHPHICKVFEVGSEGGPPFIAMQYIQGQTLGESKEKLTLREKTQLMAEVAGAIHAAHRLGLVHRDLKPSNILLEAHEDGSWVPFILDFGLARDQAVADLTLSWGFVGTPAFMSPEQARAEAASPASDIYSLGATFYALFGGHPPFEATTLAGLINQQGRQVIRSLRRLLPGFPRDLDTILLKCMDPEPARRYASAFALEEDLRRWLAGEPIHARAIGPMGRAWRRVKRYRSLSLAIAAGLGLALSLLAWNAYAARRARVQVELIQRFGLQVREVEQLLRIERMLPVHDMRPAEARVRQRMEDIRIAMTRLGSVAMGPGHYALGRGHLILSDFKAAKAELDEAERAGFNAPEVAYAQGAVLMEEYFGEMQLFHPANHEKEALETRFALPAAALFRRALGHVQEDPAFGEAQVAMLEGNLTLCIQKCREAFAAKPWMYEAKRLEAHAWMGLAGHSFGNAAHSNRPTQEGYTALEAAEQAIDAALRIAPSDGQVYKDEFTRIVLLSTLKADSGTPSRALFDRCEAMYPKALAIHPDDLDLKHNWLYSRIRQGFVLLRQGEDVRPLMQESLLAIGPDGPRLRERGFTDTPGYLRWILADGKFRRGEDPLPDLDEMEHWLRPGTVPRVQPACLRADFLASRGRNPLPVLTAAEKILDDSAEVEKANFYPFTVWGNLLLTRAEWEWDEGIDPLRTLERAVLRLEQSRRLNPNAVYPYMWLVQAHAYQAKCALALGQDPEPVIQVALTIGAQGLMITSSHHRLHLALAETRLIQARHRMTQGLDPVSALREARSSLAAGFRINPTDHRLHRQAVRTELADAIQAMRQGRTPVEALAQAERLAKRGLTYKADDPQLWLLLARSQRLRAEWAKPRGEAIAPWIAEGRKHLQRSLSLHPKLPESLAEQAQLDGLEDGHQAEPRERLRSLLERNPFLTLDYFMPKQADVVVSDRAAL